MAKKNKTLDTKIKLRNVRLSFPSLWHKNSFDGSSEGKYEATFLLPKEDKETFKIIKEAIAEARNSVDFKIPNDKLFIKDGDESDYDGYEGNWAIKASSNKRPLIIDKDKTPLTEDDGIPYAGCYVNAIIQLWVQNNSYGKRINANLLGVQFVRDGEPFGSEVNVDVDEFDDIDDEEFNDSEDEEL